MYSIMIILYGPLMHSMSNEKATIKLINTAIWIADSLALWSWDRDCCVEQSVYVHVWIKYTSWINDQS